MACLSRVGRVIRMGRGLCLGADERPSSSIWRLCPGKSSSHLPQGNQQGHGAGVASLSKRVSACYKGSCKLGQ